MQGFIIFKKRLAEKAKACRLDAIEQKADKGYLTSEIEDAINGYFDEMLDVIFSDIEEAEAKELDCDKCFHWSTPGETVNANPEDDSEEVL